MKHPPPRSVPSACVLVCSLYYKPSMKHVSGSLARVHRIEGTGRRLQTGTATPARLPGTCTTAVLGLTRINPVFNVHDGTIHTSCRSIHRWPTVRSHWLCARRSPSFLLFFLLSPPPPPHPLHFEVTQQYHSHLSFTGGRRSKATSDAQDAYCRGFSSCYSLLFLFFIFETKQNCL